MKSLVVVCLLAAVSADQAGSGPGAARYPAGAARAQGGPRGAAGAPGGAQGGYSVSPGGFKTPLGTAGYQEYHYEPSPHAFDYAVNNHDSGAQFSANENSDGKQTTGFYTVALPDGRVQTVKYTVDDFGGFNAEVSYEGDATYPDPSEYTAPLEPVDAYKQSRPVGYKQRRPVGYKPVVNAPPTYKAPAPRLPAPGFKPNVAPTYKAPAASFAAAISPKKYASE